MLRVEMKAQVAPPLSQGNQADFGLIDSINFDFGSVRNVLVGVIEDRVFNNMVGNVDQAFFLATRTSFGHGPVDELGNAHCLKQRLEPP
jgi:hypothetical protein